MKRLVHINITDDINNLQCSSDYHVWQYSKRSKMKVVVLIACMLALVAGEMCSINGMMFRKWIEESKKELPMMPEESEILNQLYYAANKGGLINKDKKMVDLSKTLQFCVCLISDPENQKKCNNNTYFCNNKVANEVIKHAISLKKPDVIKLFIQCVIDCKTLDLVDK